MGWIGITPSYMVNTTKLVPGQYVLFSRYDENPGFEAGVAVFGRIGQANYLSLGANATASLSAFDAVYDNGAIQLAYDVG